MADWMERICTVFQARIAATTGPTKPTTPAHGQEQGRTGIDHPSVQASHTRVCQCQPGQGDQAPRGQAPAHALHETLERLDRHGWRNEVMMAQKHGSEGRAHEKARRAAAGRVEEPDAGRVCLKAPAIQLNATSVTREVAGMATRGRPSPQETVAA